MKICVLGAGNMATAFANIAPKNCEVLLYAVEKSVCDEINNYHLNSKYSKTKLNNNVSASNNLKECMKSSDCVVFALPSNAVKSVAKEIKTLMPDNAEIIILSKGLREGGETMSQLLSQFFNNPIIAVAGPCIANELMEELLTYVVFASKDSSIIGKYKELFENDYYKISLSNDVLGVEYCSFLKNVYAIYLGIADGLGLGMNAKAGLISKSLDEMGYFCEKMGAKKESAYSLAGVGDLIATSLSIHGRNRKFGELISSNKSVDECNRLIGQTVEGLNALKILRKIADKKKLMLPVFENVYGIVFKNSKLSIN